MLFLAKMAYSVEIHQSKIMSTSIGKIQLIQAHEGIGYERMSGNSGLLWVVYLDEKEIGSIWAHSLAMRLEEPEPGLVRIWAYLRGGGSSGSLGYYTLSKKEVKEFNGININPGDSGTELGNILYKSVFSKLIELN